MSTNALYIQLCACWVCVTGCAPITFPDEWLHRRLLESEHAYIYASNPKAAREAVQLLQKVSMQYEDATGYGLDKGLIIVTDANDDPILEDLDELAILTFRYGLPPGQRRSDESVQRQWEGMLQSKCTLLQHAFLLGKRDLITIFQLNGELSDQISWAAVVPTRATIKRNLREAIKPAVEDMLDEVGLQGGKRFGVKAALKLKEIELRSKAEAKRDCVIYAAIVGSQPRLDDREKSDQISAYWQWSMSGPSLWRERWPLERRRKSD